MAAINMLEGMRDNSFPLCYLSLHALLVVGADIPHCLCFALPNRWCRICVLTISLPWLSELLLPWGREEERNLQETFFITL